MYCGLVAYFPLLEISLGYFDPPQFSTFFLELELEVSGLRDGADRITALVDAQGANREEHLLHVSN
jgi:hypothetical protein